MPKRGEVWMVDLGLAQQMALIEAGVRDWLAL